MSSQACNIIHNMGTIMLLLLCPTVWMLRVYLYRSLFPNTKGFYYLKKKKKKKEYAKIFKILGFRNKLLRPEYLWDLGDYLPIHSDLHFPP